MICATCRANRLITSKLHNPMKTCTTISAIAWDRTSQISRRTGAVKVCMALLLTPIWRTARLNSATHWRLIPSTPASSSLKTSGTRRSSPSCTTQTRNAPKVMTRISRSLSTLNAKKMTASRRRDHPTCSSTIRTKTTTATITSKCMTRLAAQCSLCHPSQYLSTSGRG